MTDWPFANPVLTASGCGGTGRELAAYGDLGALGGFVTRSVTLRARPGGDRTPAGRVRRAAWSTRSGCRTPASTAFLADELPPLLDLGAAVVASIAGTRWGSTPSSRAPLGRAPG